MHPQDDLPPCLYQACVHRFTPAPLDPPLGDSPSPSPPPLHQLHLPTHCIEIRATSCYFVQNTMVVHLGPRGNQKMKMLKVRFFNFLRQDLCRACSEVSETGFGSKIGQRQPKNERYPLWTPSANPAVAENSSAKAVAKARIVLVFFCRPSLPLPPPLP